MTYCFESIPFDTSSVKRLRQNNEQNNNIEQYLRVNNLEFIGLPKIDDNSDKTNEEVLLEAINTLDLGYEVTSDDIDISHPIPTKRKDGKSATICKFVSRKTKFDILDAKKKIKDFRFRARPIFINEHLSPKNREIFAKTQIRRKELNYKYIWSSNGNTFVRKKDGDSIITIKKLDDIDKLT